MSPLFKGSGSAQTEITRVHRRVTADTIYYKAGQNIHPRKKIQNLKKCIRIAEGEQTFLQNGAFGEKNPHFVLIRKGHPN